MTTSSSIKVTGGDMSTGRPIINLFLDFDGTVAETESLFTLTQFNRMFARKQLNITWDDVVYKELLLVGSSEHRLFHYFDKFDCWPMHVDGYSSGSLDEKKRLCWHLKQSKDEELNPILVEIVANTAHNNDWSGSDSAMPSSQSSSPSPPIGCSTSRRVLQKREPSLSLRPGIFDLVSDTIHSNPLNNIAICSNSKTDLVQALMEVLFPVEILQRIVIFGGDMVDKGRLKPHPDLYLLAAKAFNLTTEDLRDRTVVIEDTNIGVVAAKAAGVGCIIATRSYFSGDQAFPLANVVVGDLLELVGTHDDGDGSDTRAGASTTTPTRVVSIDYLVSKYRSLYS
jgi:beta-phosphoglucomutase-like phosphatase (HAD superfamily)